MVDGAALDRLGPTGLAASLRGGVDCVQVRDRALDGRALLAQADLAVDVARRAPHPVRVLVNRRLDVARCAGADGVHLGFDAPPPAEARRQLGPDAWIGISAHAPEEVRGATGADYAHLAPVFDPLSKPPQRPALGLARLAEACAGGTRVWAQGGIDPGNAAAVIAAGASGVAVTGALSGAPDPERAARALRDALDARAA